MPARRGCLRRARAQTRLAKLDIKPTTAGGSPRLRCNLSHHRKGQMMNNTKRLHHRVGAAIVFAAVAILALPASGDDREDRDDRHDESQVRRGFQISPPGVALNLAGKNRALVGLGSYVVNTSGCLDCHTHPAYAPGGDPFKGEPEMINAAQYMSGGRTFGPFTAANLTPDFAGRPAGLTLQVFVRTMRTGHDPDIPGKLLQVMPWPVYGKKTDRDLIAIYEYLRSIPSLPNNPNPGP
jgi:hypothetical protein